MSPKLPEKLPETRPATSPGSPSWREQRCHPTRGCSRWRPSAVAGRAHAAGVYPAPFLCPPVAGTFLPPNREAAAARRRRTAGRATRAHQALTLSTGRNPAPCARKGRCRASAGTDSAAQHHGTRRTTAWMCTVREPCRPVSRTIGNGLLERKIATRHVGTRALLSPTVAPRA